jgi:hypothetical protein
MSGKGKLNGTAIDLSFREDVPLTKRKRRTSYERASAAVRRACKGSSSLWGSDMTSAKLLVLIDAALRDEFHPVGKRRMKKQDTYLNRALLKLERDIA